MKSIFENPIKLVITTIVLSIASFAAVAVLPFSELDLHGAHAHTQPPEDPLVLKGHEVYYEAGCQSCHTQNIRPFKAEILRYTNVEKYTNTYNADARELVFFTPSVTGSRRIGPDLAAAASKYSQEGLTELLQSKEGFHNYTYLFAPADAGGRSMEPLRLSWKIRWMMNAGVPFSDPYQRGVFDRLEESTRGDALVAYLLFLGKRNLTYESQFYKQ
jgi:cytochrome c oxidase cbb3-type subunit 2